MSVPFYGLAKWLKTAVSGESLYEASERLRAQASQAEVSANTLMDLSIVLQLMHDKRLALMLQNEALKDSILYRIASRKSAKLRLLLLMVPGDLMGNAPIECLVDHDEIEVTLLYVGTGHDWTLVVPDHDLLMVAVGESDRTQALLYDLDEVLRAWPRPVLNAPKAIAQLTRDKVSERLQTAPSLCSPITKRMTRASLEALAGSDAAIQHGLFPELASLTDIVIRPVNSHAGIGLERLAHNRDLGRYLQESSSQEFYVCPFVDYRQEDGLFCKYRVVLIKGRAFISHIAMSEHWMIHYVNAGMMDDANKRLQEQTLMSLFEHGFATRHAQALEVISKISGLDYVGIDCAELQDGRLLVFEIDPSMVVHNYDSQALFAYKQAPMNALIQAFQSMLFDQLNA